NATDIHFPYDSSMDFTSLPWLEQQWVAWYIYIGNPVIATGLMSFLMHEIVYFDRSIPWIIIDAIPYFRRWKLQPTRIRNLYEVPLPSLRNMAPQIALFFIFEDIFHYFAHQALHYGPLYKHIHKIHHKYSAPFGLAAEYAHSAEVAILGTGIIAGPLLYCHFNSNLHISTVYIWITLRLFHAIDAHSGYDFPWSLQHIHHDFHHMAFTNNFSTSFRWRDCLFGTDNKYREYRVCVDAAKGQMKNAPKEDRIIMEQKFMAEVEAEGLRAEAEVERSATKAKVQ
ncbi:C-4 methyl sterol oxidase, partial [Mycena sp. CBHHK59/15]